MSFQSIHRSSDEEVTKQEDGEVMLKPPTRMCIWKSKRCYYRNPMVKDLLLQLERIKEGSKVADVCQVQLTTEAKSKSEFNTSSHGSIDVRGLDHVYITKNKAI
jgi:hypothetical protein